MSFGFCSCWCVVTGAKTGDPYAPASGRCTTLSGAPVRAENSAALCDLRVFVEQATESITSIDLDISVGWIGKCHLRGVGPGLGTARRSDASARAQSAQDETIRDPAPYPARPPPQRKGFRSPGFARHQHLVGHRLLARCLLVRPGTARQHLTSQRHGSLQEHPLTRIEWHVTASRNTKRYPYFRTAVDF